MMMDDEKDKKFLVGCCSDVPVDVFARVAMIVQGK